MRNTKQILFGDGLNSNATRDDYVTKMRISRDPEQ
jgi:hypothetical protein